MSATEKPAASATGAAPTEAEKAALADELLAAMAEIESLSAEPKRGPSDAGESRNTVSSTVTGADGAPAEPATPSDASEPSPATGAASGVKGLRFKVGAKAASGTPAVHDAATREAPAPAVESTDPPRAEESDDDLVTPGVAPTVPVLKRAYRWLDGGLELISWPLLRAGSTMRRVVGAVSLTTIAVTLAASLVLPLFMPYRDAVTFLRDKREKLERELQAEKSAATAGEAASHASEAHEDDAEPESPGGHGGH